MKGLKMYNRFNPQQNNSSNQNRQSNSSYQNRQSTPPHNNNNNNNNNNNVRNHNGMTDSKPEKENASFENNPKLTGIDPLKLKIILEIKNKSKNKSIEELLPEIMKINQELNRRQMNFTKQESELLLDAIEESLSPADKQKFNMIKSFMN